MAWQPDQVKLDQVGQLLQGCADPSNHERHVQALQMLAQGKRDYPDFGCYLFLVFCKIPTASPELRQMAGIELKNTIKSFHRTMSPAVMSFLKTAILEVLGEPSRPHKRIAAQIITTVVGIAELSAWPELLPGLMNLLDSADHLEGALMTMKLLCEDHSHQLCKPAHDAMLNAMLAKFITLFSSPSPESRANALNCIRQFVLPLPNALLNNLNAFLQGLLALHKDPEASVRKEICQSLCLLVEVKADFLADPNICQFVVEFLLWTTEHDTDYDVKKEACEFWSSLCENEEVPPGVLKPYLSRLTLVLLNGMVYSEDELIALSDEADNVPDRPEDLDPSLLHHHSKHACSAPDPEDDDEDDDGGIEWTLRKCSAAGLDVIANAYQADILDALLPHIHDKLQASEWQVVESAVLAMGALAEGCEAGLTQRQYLPNFVVHLISTLLESPQPLVRSITCWTLSRYSRWICNQRPPPTPENPNAGMPAMLEPLVNGLLKRMLDGSKKVQEAGCSAMAVLEEEAHGLLTPFISQILQVYNQAFARYQAKNLVILYDAVGTLAEAVGKELNRPEHIALLLPPLITKWEALADEDKSLFPLLECLSNVVQALRGGFEQYAHGVYQRCERLIEMTLTSQQQQTETMFDDEFIVCSLDLISGMAEGLGSGIESLVANGKILPMLMECCQHMMPDVRQSAFAVVGDLSKAALPHLLPYLEPIFQLVVANLDPDHVSVCNNACWSAGELAVRLPPEMAEVMPNFIMPLLIPLINLMGRPGLNKSLLENTAITLGRFGLVCPDLVAGQLNQFVQPWCRVLAGIRDDKEKEQSFRGMLKMVLINPQGCIDSFEYLVLSLDSWNIDKMPPDLRKELASMLAWFKQNLQQAGQWEAIYARVPAEVQQKMVQKYDVAP
eukprot:CAMPEP_0181303378 /NCGR_PEP_ID=MMETSP1101-20121128/8524_1 /TAXON_ID=46948 /ORGANISM="Rhodomonas abbreviata, Strain Caron Lab Isolate" /LENGTH=900 /DNA_ID=CAMNT_0023408943 /DNA_START=172 /DNA_END=2874 /DNA_ORIENTATION=-